MENQQIDYELIKQRTNRLLRDLKEIKEFFGTLTDCKILHGLEFARFDWMCAPVILLQIRPTIDLFVWCVEQNIFDLVKTDEGKKISNFSAFNRSGYRNVEAFLRTIENYHAIQMLEIDQQWKIENPVIIAYTVLGGSKTFSDYEAELFSEQVDFFPKTNEGRMRLSTHRDNMAVLEVARTIVEAMPDFDIKQLHANAKPITPDGDFFDYLLYDFVSIAESVLGFERPKNRLTPGESIYNLNLLKMLKTQNA